MNYGVFQRTLRHQDERFQAGSNTLTKATERTASGSKTAGCRCATNHTGSEFDMYCILTRRKEEARQVPRDRGIFVILAVSRCTVHAHSVMVNFIVVPANSQRFHRGVGFSVGS
jgi:hypothetical protein